MDYSECMFRYVALYISQLYDFDIFIVTGCCPSPFDCFLVNRSLTTLELRMEKHMSNGLAVARFLETHPMVQSVNHPGICIKLFNDNSDVCSVPYQYPELGFYCASSLKQQSSAARHVS